MNSAKPNHSLQPTCYGLWPSHAAELKRWAAMNSRALTIVVAACLLVPPTSSFADEKRADICAKYETENGWSKGYKVQANIISGSDFNEAVHSFTRFRAFSTYLTIFWDKDEVTILELPATSMGSVPMFETTVKDEAGRKWRIKEGHDFC